MSKPDTKPTERRRQPKQIEISHRRGLRRVPAPVGAVVGDLLPESIERPRTERSEPIR